MDFPTFSDETNFREQPTATVVVSAQLIQAIATMGWKGDGIECIQGLPPTAKFVKLVILDGSDKFGIVFADESFADNNGKFLKAAFKKTYESPSP